MTTRPFRSLLAVVVACVTLVALSAPPARAEAGASLSGRVVASDGVSPRSGVTVALYDSTSETTWRSAPTGDDGAFRVADAPQGSYSLLVESGGGAFLAPQPLVLAGGENPPLALRLDPLAPGQAAAPASGLSPVVKWVIVGVIAAAGILVINEVTDDEEEPASPFDTD